MNCMNCGAFLADKNLDYCPGCGCNVLIQKKVVYLSRVYYNRGLEKATVRDLSGAIDCLKLSLTYNKRNIRARNLLGLVYFETGEVVAALSEWVISKNLKPTKNLANEYINRLQASSNKLDAINETIKKYNNALALCREGHDDMAAVQLHRILSQNSKLIKGYHLLALIQMKNHEWGRARRILRRAARIDKTNTTTLRFLQEVDEQTGVTTRLERQKNGLFGAGKKQTGEEGIETITVRPAIYRERSGFSLFFTLMLGIAAGAAAFWLLAVPSIRQGIYREANQQIVNYSESLSSQGTELSKAQEQAAESDDAAEQVTLQLNEEKKTSQTYESLFNAYIDYLQENYDGSALEIQNVYEDSLADDTAKSIYNMLCDETGVTGIASEDAKADADADSEETTSGY